MSILPFFKVSPGGNITILIPEKNFSRSVHQNTAKSLLSRQHLYAEQVGFIDPAAGTLTMAGGEFCVNATRAFGAVLARSRSVAPISPSSGMEICSGGGEHRPGVSGKKIFLPVRRQKNSEALLSSRPSGGTHTRPCPPNDMTSRPKMCCIPAGETALSGPFPAVPRAGLFSSVPHAGTQAGSPPDGFSSSDPYTASVRVSGTDQPVIITAYGKDPVWNVTAELVFKEAPAACSPGEGFTLLHLPGIDHLLIDAAVFPRPEDWRRASADLRHKFGMEQREAAGCIWWSRTDAGFAMEPVVWVRDCDSTFLESACGSGAAACALGIGAVRNAALTAPVPLLQPSGEALTVQLCSDGPIWKASIGGPVRIIAEGQVFVE